MKAIWNGQVIAESEDTVVVEGNHYFPAESLNRDYVEDSQTTTTCGWKGDANYLTLVVDGERNVDAVWFYRNPKPAANEILGRVAFWRGVKIVD